MASDHQPTMATRDVARFHEDDVDDLVAASFACPVCLHGAVTAEIDRDGGRVSVARCRCDRCDERWRLLVHRRQLYTLASRGPVLRGPFWQVEIRFGDDWL